MHEFKRIYEEDEWVFGSGHGSLPSVTRGYRRFLQRFLATWDIETVVDLGCGDWQFSRLLDWSGVSYLGLDVVDDVLAKNNERFRSANIAFSHSPRDFEELPGADLLIAKDVLQHWHSDRIFELLTVLPKYNHALLTNCVFPPWRQNTEIADGEFRPLDLRKPPFNLDARKVYAFSKFFTVYLDKGRIRRFPPWRKIVLHWRRG